MADYKYIINIKPGSKRYKNGFKLNPTGDQAYILGSNAIVTVPKSYDYLLPYDQLPVYPDLNKIYGSIQESCVFSDLYKFWLGRMLQPFAFDYKLIQKLHDKDNAVCVADPDRKGVVLCTYDYSVRVEKEYAGGAKLKEVGATTTFRGDTAHTSLDYEYQGGAKFSAPEVASIGGSPLMYTKTNTPDNYYIATNIK